MRGGLAVLLGIGWKRGAPSVAIGVGAVWGVVAASRGYRVTTICSWTGDPALPLWPVFGAALATAMVAGGIAFLLARSRFGRLSFGLPTTLALRMIAAVAFGTRSTPSQPAAPTQSTADAMDSNRFVSPLDPQTTNVLLICIDTLRADHTSLDGYGRNTSPTMQELADQGVMFERCVTQRTSSAPSMATLLTGTYPPTHRVFNNRDSLQDFNLTLAEMLRTAGFTTAAFSTNSLLSETFNFHQGFSHFEMTAERVPEDELVESREVNTTFLGWLADHRTEHFFVWVHYKDPHTPYTVPDEYETLYTSDAMSADHGHRQIPFGRGSNGTIMPAAVVDGSQDLDFYVAQYDAETRFVDDSLGELMTALEEMELKDKTLIILTSDHGESLGEREVFFAHGDDCYEPTAHVPLVFWHPDLAAGTRVSAPVSLVDLVPTVRDLLGLPVGSLVQGRSLASILTGEGDSPARAHQFIIGAWRNGYQTHAVTTARHKLILDVDPRWIYFDVGVERLVRRWLGDSFSSADRYRCRVVVRELYDLLDDPDELANLADQRLDVQAELETALWDWMDEVYRIGAAHAVTTGELTPEGMDQLRALGYVE